MTNDRLESALAARGYTLGDFLTMAPSVTVYDVATFEVAFRGSREAAWRWATQ